MHHHLEIIMPPILATNPQDAIEQILRPFDESLDRDSEDRSTHPFWDYWRIGGRWSGTKLMHGISTERLDAFYARLKECKVMVSGVQAGKPTLKPETQIPLVDAMWGQDFDDLDFEQCPLFDHYKGDDGDTMALKDCPRDLKCERVIIAAPDYRRERLEAKFMVQDMIWNDVTHQKTTWDQTIGGALAEWAEKLKNYTAEYAADMTPQDNWLVVTVDYHS